MPEGIVTELTTFLPFRIRTYFNDIELSSATGFLFEGNRYCHLITNHHVVSGLHNETKQTLHSQGAVPNRLEGEFPVLIQEMDGDRSEFSLVAFQRSLLREDGTSDWHEHPVYRDSIDIVSVPICKRSEVNAWSVNKLLDRQPDFGRAFELSPGQDGFILGFPAGIQIAERLPIWKRFTIASEPSFLIDSLPKFYVDTATRQGMSGAPAICQISGSFPAEGLIWARKRKFVGVYSGRVGDGEFQSQLGIIWRASLVDELVASFDQ